MKPLANVRAETSASTVAQILSQWTGFIISWGGRHCTKWSVSWPWNSVIRTRILHKYGNLEEYRVPYTRRYHQVSWPGFPLVRTFSVSRKIRYLDTSLKRCVSKSMYVRILCDLTRIRISTLLAHCFIYGVGHLYCLELFHKYCFITNIRGDF